mgnify:CR=1 FL=1
MNSAGRALAHEDGQFLVWSAFMFADSQIELDRFLRSNGKEEDCFPIDFSRLHPGSEKVSLNAYVDDASYSGALEAVCGCATALHRGLS